MSFTLTTTYQTTCPARRNPAVLHLGGPPEPFEDGSLTITPVMSSGGSAFGAEISNVDWSQSIPVDIVTQV